MMGKEPQGRAIRTVNLKSDMPQVHEALQRLDRELAQARQEKANLLKFIHGYGSTGRGGDIRIAVQKRLSEMTQNGQIRGRIFGEDWSKSDETVWKLVQSHPELKGDSDLGRRNLGITIVLL
jgi:adenosylmethionine-8-amino-7-oxononanoate aminotransferase